MALNNAHDFSIGNATFNTHIVHNPRPLPSQPADILHLARAAEASHRSNTATYATKCHPKTREKVIADIVDWVVEGKAASRHSSPRKSILWFSGPAGGGKTCVMRNVVDCCEAKGLLAASYFFSTRGSGVTIERPFVATVVHQLNLSQPDLKKEVLDIIQGYPTIFEESLDFQMDTLLVRPLRSTPLQPHSRKIVIVIDGLDECSEEREREHLLNLLHTLVTKLPRLITVVVASRPEFDLRRLFASSKLSKITKIVQLQKYDGTKDVRVFLCDQFEEIRRSHPLRMLIPEGWPFDHIVQLLVDKSSGNFILPSIAAMYIKKSRRNPVDSLNIIMGLLENPSPDTSNPFAELDALYSHILHPPDTDLALVKRILHYIHAISAGGNPHFLDPTFLDEFLDLPPGTASTTLCDLHAILYVPDSADGIIKFHHKSLEDYLLDPKRSHDFFQSRYHTHLDITTACARCMARWDGYQTDIKSILMRRTLNAVFDIWPFHFGRCLKEKPISETLPDIVLNIDPRIHAKYVFLCHWDPRDSGLRPPRLHVKLCSEQRCARICQLAAHVESCPRRLSYFTLTFKTTYKERLETLPRFLLETRLYAPVHQDSRAIFDARGRLIRLENPSLGDEVEDFALQLR